MSSAVVWLTTNPVSTWLIRNFSSRVDPWLFRATNGRLTSFGPPAMPMLTLTARGRRSGEPRSVHLACVEDRGDWLIVASAMGQQKHPAWRYNIEVHPEVEVQAIGERFTADAVVLDDTEKERVWDRMREAIPQLDVYQARTDRNIRIFRLKRRASPTKSD